MQNSIENRFEKNFVNKFNKFESGMSEIERKKETLFESRPFENSYIIIFTHDFKFSFKEDYGLPLNIMEETKGFTNKF